MRFANSKNIAIGVLGAAVVGLGSWVAVDHLATPATAQTASLTASSTKQPATGTQKHWPLGAGRFGFGSFAGASGMMGELGTIQKDLGVPASTILKDLKNGETLAQIAGANTSKVEADVDSAIQTQLNKLVSSGAISSSQESQLYADAQNAVSVVMNMKLSALLQHHSG